MAHYNKHDILVDNQHGFRRGRSCETQLTITTHAIAKALNDRQQLDAVILDFSKAFDRVPHMRLLKKLQHYGLSTQWVEVFLTNRLQ